MARKPQTESAGGSVAKKSSGTKRSSPRATRKVVPLKDLSPAYRKRIRAAAAKAGVPVARFRRDAALIGKARGHAPTAPGKSESQLRRERLNARIEALAERQAYRGRSSANTREAAEIADSYRALIRDRGQGAFGRLERTIANRRRGEGAITEDELDFDWEDYGGEATELHYH
jgi:signal transduction protein with GAF and PtsI domain